MNLNFEKLAAYRILIEQSVVAVKHSTTRQLLY
jgi:hypothetical protein